MVFKRSGTAPYPNTPTIAAPAASAISSTAPSMPAASAISSTVPSAFSDPIGYVKGLTMKQKLIGGAIASVGAILLLRR
jgi:hypothetical protein